MSNKSKGKPIEKKNKTSASSNEDFGFLNQSFYSKNKLWRSIILGITLFFSIILFNARISEGGDDSSYILAAFKYANDFANYSFTFQAPFYPLFLSVFVKIAGINLLLLKGLSVLFNLTGVALLFYTLRNRENGFIALTVLLLVALNMAFHYYAGQTYTEAFYFMLQSAYIFLIAKYYDSAENSKSNTILLLSIGFFAFLLSFTKNAGIVSPIAAILFFALYKQFKAILLFLAGFAVPKLIFEMSRKFIWQSTNQYNSQSTILLQKDPYDAKKGMEDFSGFIDRFTENCDLYLSKNLLKIFGFVDEYYGNNHSFMTVMVITLMVVGLFYAYKNNHKILLFAGLYASAMTVLSFIILQTRWDQPRIIVIYLPIYLWLIFYGLVSLSKQFGFGFKVTAILLSFSLIAGSAVSSLRAGAKNIPSLTRNLKGDLYYGYTPDWVNFLKMSSWIGENLNKNDLVTSRKAPMSFIYSNGKEFYPIYSVLSTDADTVVKIFKEKKITHVMLASLRRSPQKADGYIINTIHRMIAPVLHKYPQSLTQVHVEGQYENTTLYKINYDKISPEFANPNPQLPLQAGQQPQ
jgi:hypothetical protein